MSFAAEMKDFITAAEAGQKMAGATDDRAYKQQLLKQSQETTRAIKSKTDDEDGLGAATVRGINARTGASNAAAATSGVHGRLLKYQLDKLQHPDPVASDVPATPYGAPAVGPAASPDTEVAPQLSSGGAVKKYAGGGAVDADSAPPPAEEEPAPTAAVPADGEEEQPGAADAANAAEGTPGDTDFSSRGRGFSPDAATTALKAGMTYGAHALGLHGPGAAVGGNSAGRDRAAKAWATGAHAAPSVDVKKIEDWVDPDHKMPEGVRGLAGIGAVYQFKEKQGDNEGAAKMAFQMIQAKRQAAQQYAVIAAQAAKGGDIDTAMHATMKSYDNTPDDRHVKLMKTPDGNIAYQYIDSATGKTMQHGIMTPDQLAAQAMGFAEKGFDESLMAAFQRRPVQQPKAAVDPSSIPLKPEDRKTGLKQVDASWDNFVAGQTPTNDKGEPDESKAPKFPASEVKALKGSAFRILAAPQNSRLHPDEAMDITARLAGNMLNNPDGTHLMAKQTEGGVLVRSGDNPPVFLPQDDFKALTSMRLAKKKVADDKAKADAAEASKPGILDRISGGVSKVLAARDEARKGFVPPPAKPAPQSGMPPAQTLE